MTRKLAVAFVVLSAVLAAGHSVSYVGGAPGASTGAPGESTCIVCHVGADLNSGTAYAELSISIPDSGYLPGQSYPGYVLARQPGIARFGFALTALGPGGQASGQWSVTSPVTTQSFSFLGRNYLTHTSSGTLSPDSVRWDFEWQAPGAQEGLVSFYAAVNVTNDDGSSSDDTIYTIQRWYGDSTLAAGEISLQNQVAAFVRDSRLVLVNEGLQVTGCRHVTLYSPEGRCVAYQAVFPFPGLRGGRMEVSLPSLPRGIYFFRVQADDARHFEGKVLYE